MGTDSKVSMKSVANRCGEDVMEKILIVGPSSTKSKGGMRLHMEVHLEKEFI